MEFRRDFFFIPFYNKKEVGLENVLQNLVGSNRTFVFRHSFYDKEGTVDPI